MKRNVQDKTFGLKNKKGSKQQKFIQQVQHQVTQGGKTAKQVNSRERLTCVHSITVNSSDNHHFSPPDNHHRSDDVYWT